MSEIDEHFLRFFSPHVYKCSCGMTAYLHPDGTKEIAEYPKGEIEYLPCGHASCAKAIMFDCIICAMSG